MTSWLEQARTTSGLAPSACARALGVSNAAWAAWEKNPGTLTLNEVGALLRLFEGPARAIVVDALRSMLR